MFLQENDKLSLRASIVETLAATGKPVILVLNEGRPRLINGIAPMADAIVHTFLPGNYRGNALANLLSGESNFSGRLPYTYPKYHGSFITYDCKPCEYVETMEGAYNYDANTPVQWSFGYGLSYSEVEYKDLKLVELAFKDAVGPLSIIFALQAADRFEPAFR